MDNELIPLFSEQTQDVLNGPLAKLGIELVDGVPADVNPMLRPAASELDPILTQPTENK